MEKGGQEKEVIRLFEEQFVEHMRDPQDDDGELLPKEIFHELLYEATRSRIEKLLCHALTMGYWERHLRYRRRDD